MLTDTTTVDDVIEHVLMRLSTDFNGSCLQLPDFCRRSLNERYDSNMELKARTKMYKHNVAEWCNGIGQPETAIKVTAFGIEVFEGGGWKKYLADYEEEEAERKKREKQSPISNYGNMVIGNNNGQMNQSFNSRHNFTAEYSRPILKDNQRPSRTSKVLKYIWEIVSSLIVTCLGIYLEHNYGFFSERWERFFAK